MATTRPMRFARCAPPAWTAKRMSFGGSSTPVFREAFPNSFARWREAETLLQSAHSERELTTIGHKAREALQEFAPELGARHEPLAVNGNPALVKRRLGAVIAKLRPQLGEARAALLEALGDYA